MNADFAFAEIGDEFLLKPLTSPARRWLVENVPPTVPYIGESAVVPASSIGLVLEQIDRAGLIVVQRR